MVDKRVSGAAKRLRGSVTEALGKLTGDQSGEARGTAQKREGEAEVRAAKSASMRKRDKPLT